MDTKFFDSAVVRINPKSEEIRDAAWKRQEKASNLFGMYVFAMLMITIFTAQHSSMPGPFYVPWVVWVASNVVMLWAVYRPAVELGIRLSDFLVWRTPIMDFTPVVEELKKLADETMQMAAEQFFQADIHKLEAHAEEMLRFEASLHLQLEERLSAENLKTGEMKLARRNLIADSRNELANDYLRLAAARVIIPRDNGVVHFIELAKLRNKQSA